MVEHAFPPTGFGLLWLTSAARYKCLSLFDELNVAADPPDFRVTNFGTLNSVGSLK